jgi:starch phosphorylase
MADFAAYVDTQRQVSTVWGDPDQWTRMSVLNVSRIGHFSSDRSIAEYVEKIWKVEPTRIPNDLP